jgi:hypothetical protein
MWVPTALLPRFGVRWSSHDDHHVTARFKLGGTPVDVRYELDGEYRIRSLVFDRWGDPDHTGAWAWHSFGGEVTRHRTFGGVTVPSAGRVGWFFSTDRWPAGAFLRYQITDLELQGGTRLKVPTAERRRRRRAGEGSGWSTLRQLETVPRHDSSRR